MSGTNTTIKLDHPFEFAGRKITEVSLRRPKTKDVVNAKKLTKSDDDFQLTLICNLAELEPDLLLETDAADYSKISEVVQGFLS